MTDQLIFVHDKRRDAYVDKTSRSSGCDRPERMCMSITARRGYSAIAKSM